MTPTIIDGKESKLWWNAGDKGTRKRKSNEPIKSVVWHWTAGAMKSEKLGGWSPWALAREFAELKKWEEETLLIINNYGAPSGKLVGITEENA